jgi:hypothetical protein
MWASVPLFNQRHWTPPAFQAEVAAKAKYFPSVASWKMHTIRRADGAMKYDWPVPLDGPPGHDQGYRCRKCSRWLEPKTPVSFNHHFCQKCKQEFVDNDFLNKAWIRRYHSRRAKNMQDLAKSWLLTGNVGYADKAIDILMAYADAHPKLAIKGTRSTSGASRLGGSTLGSSYVIPYFAEAYWYLYRAPTLDEKRRKAIETMLLRMGRNVARHSVEYNNQQAEHFRAYGSVGLAARFWPLVAEAIYGDFGWHELVEYGYSEDGIAHEGGAYHNSVYQAMNHFGLFSKEMGLDLYTPRFKRVFDGSLQANAIPPGSPFYELAYAAYRDPTYIPELERVRKRATEISMFHGVLGLPSVKDLPARSVHMPGAGYIYLKKGNAADWFGISLNYIKQFDRHERDRFTTFFLRNGSQIDRHVGRITYGSQHSRWMEATAAHNTIVIDGKDQQAEEGILLKYDGSPDLPLAVVATHPKAPFYEGVRQVRGIALVEDFFVVFDRIDCDRPRTIDRYQYGKGVPRMSFKAAALPALPSLPERGAFNAFKGGNCGKDLRIDFTGNDLKMRLVSDQDIHAYQAITVGGYQATPMEVTFARRKAKEATFLAAFSIGKASEPPALRILVTSKTRLKLEVKTAKKVHVLDLNIRGE